MLTLLVGLLNEKPMEMAKRVVGADTVLVERYVRGGGEGARAAYLGVLYAREIVGGKRRLPVLVFLRKPPVAGYLGLTYGDRDTVVIVFNPQGGLEDYFSVGLHEGFHYFGGVGEDAAIGLEGLYGKDYWGFRKTFLERWALFEALPLREKLRMPFPLLLWDLEAFKEGVEEGRVWKGTEKLTFWELLMAYITSESLSSFFYPPLSEAEEALLREELRELAKGRERELMRFLYAIEGIAYLHYQHRKDLERLAEKMLEVIVWFRRW